MKRINHYFDRHPLIAIAVGYLALIAVILAVVPADPPSVDAAVHVEKTT